SRNTSRARALSRARRLSSAMASACRARPSATSWPSPKRPVCWRTRITARDAPRPTRATRSTSNLPSPRGAPPRPSTTAARPRSAIVLNEGLTHLAAEQIERRLGRFDRNVPVGALAHRIGERIARVMREYDAASIEELFSDGLLNVMAAPEFAETEKLRRVW